jgi:DNA-binding XRE family transcriptional regulator
VVALAIGVETVAMEAMEEEAVAPQVTVVTNLVDSVDKEY